MITNKFDNETPTQWNTNDVLEWASNIPLPKKVCSALEENEIDGPILLTLSQADLKDELGIRSLGARRFLWENIKFLQNNNHFHELKYAIQLHIDEIETCEEKHEAVDSCVVHTLREDVKEQLQIIQDFEFANQNDNRVEEMMMLQSYEDAVVAQSLHDDFEKMRLTEQYDHACAVELSRERGMEGSTRSRGARSTSSRTSTVNTQAKSNIKSLESLCIDICAANRINVAESIRNGVVTLPSRLGEEMSILTEVEEENDEMSEALPKLPPVKCSVCYEDGIGGFDLNCRKNHSYCKACMTTFLRTANKDVSLFPLTCCEDPIDVSIGKWCLKKKEYDTLQVRQEEAQARNKMYCPKCNIFINLDTVSHEFTYVCKCKTLLCLTCKAKYHPGITCKENRKKIELEDQSTQSFLKLIKNEKLQQCPTCKVTVELVKGCNHMTCSFCKTDFCYQCGSLWNINNGLCASGKCKRWEEEKIMERGEERVIALERQAGRDFQPRERRIALNRAMEALETNETCHHEWNRQNHYGGECERCGYDLAIYGMICQGGCRSVVCYTCAHHRIPSRGWG